MQSDTREKSCSGIRSRMLRVMSALLIAACGGEPPSEVEAQGGAPESFVAPSAVSTRPQGLASTNKVLILAGTVTGGADSVEAKVARNLLGYTVEVASDAAWAAKTSADFASYRAIILGDATCSTSRSVLQAAVNNRDVWGPVVDGNVIIVGTDPVWHSATPVTHNAIRFAAAQEGKTGIYISLSCYYHATAPLTPVPVLAPFGHFTVTGVGCYNDAHIVATHSALSGLTSNLLSNWSCSVHEAFDTYPAANFTPLVIARDPLRGPRLPGSRDFADGSHGVPYILARGAIPVRCGDGVVQYPEECDTGTSNGVPGTVCSSVCRLHWCGDGVLDPGEDCDTGAGNGSGTCSASCRSIVTARPPVARCKDLDLSAITFCGATGSVDDGSYDPDGNLESCTQTPDNPYGVGTTTVTLTCVDATQLSSSCTARVIVTDAVAPTVALEGDSTVTLECGTPYIEPGVSAFDICDGDLTSAVTVSGSVNTRVSGTYTLTYSARDAAGHVGDATRTVKVVPGASGTCDANGGWIPTGGMALPRLLHTATLLDDGRVLVAGGFNFTSEVYDPETKTWSATGDTISTHRGHTATRLRDGRVLIAGGGQCSFTGITSELYVPELGKWKPAGQLNQLRFHHTAVLLPNGKVLVAGGGSSEYGGGVLASSELYDPATNTWSATGSMGSPRRFHTANLLPDGRVLVAGGYHPLTGILTASELYDPATGTWSVTAAMNVDRYQHTATLLNNGTVLAVGGVSNHDQASAEYYDLAEL